MGIWDKIKGEFIDIIEWLDDTQDTVVYRFERHNNEIKYGAKLTVRESQVAVFVNEGQIADVYPPGMYTLETQNMPILSTLKGWKYGFNSPFKAEVYFVNTKRFTDQKWGTMNPIMMRDADFGIVRVRAFGSYAFRVKEAAKFLREVAGTDWQFTTDEINEQLRNMVVSKFAEAIAEMNIPVIDLAAKYGELGAGLTSRIQPMVDEFGIEILTLLIENVSVPPEVEAMIDKRSSMGIVGNLNQFTQFQMATSMEKAAENPGGMGAAGMGMGAGMAMASMMGQQMQQTQPQPGGAPPPVPQAAQYYVAVNGQQTGPFGLDTLRQMAASGQFTPESLIWAPGMTGWVAANTVGEVASVFAAVPPPVPPPA